ncbi:hypothetical protein [Paenibacillus polymyxa]|uniref:Uncharacterized protein n=1 Tax=Paenibacillus polymyxa (strain SC2) TaxID=886882 RepID=E3EL89_PAEPS|nr:hypothetical protein [Paenibacillus polymyxa]ADO59921.1 hypothetical protein PPSC2_28565 [Paenibacillus polymyxa SC2]WPQ59855.1 hypothetical protein SKN87_26575 [Paenibacillus polymyxa]
MIFEYFKNYELNHILTKLLSGTDTSIRCEIGFSEKLDTDCVNIYKNGQLVDTKKMEAIFEPLSVHINAKIKSYDVMEVGDDGEVFVFFLEGLHTFTNVA